MSNISIQRGEEWLQNLLDLAGVSTEVRGDMQTTSSLDKDSPETESCWLTIDQTNLMPEQIRILTGADASVLDAIQHLANSVLNLNEPEEQQVSYIIELNGYRVKRQAEIRSLVETAAAEVRFSGREVEIKSLNSAERREVHTFFSEFADLETFSRGKEPQRNLVVRPASQAQENGGVMSLLELQSDNG